MNSRKLAGASAASVGAATAVAALLLGTLSGTAGEETTASAFGIAAKGLIDIPPTPYVEAPPEEREALLEVPGDDHNGDSDGINVALFKVKAEHFRSKATAVKVDLLGLKLRLIEARCDNGRGDSEIISTDTDGKPFPSDPYSGQELDLSPIIKVEFNRQHRDDDWLTVDALVVKLLPGGRNGQAVSAKDLTDLKLLAPNLKVPTMEELKAENPSSPTPTVGNLTNMIKQINPTLARKASGDDDSLLEVIVSSASCKEEREKIIVEKPEEVAPPPVPVEAELPVTH